MSTKSALCMIAAVVMVVVAASFATALQRPPALLLRSTSRYTRPTNPCIDNITAAAGQVGASIIEVVRAVADCPKANNTAQCVADITAVAKYLAQAGADISMAVTACGGPGSKCATDLVELGRDLSGAASDVAQAAADCADKQSLQCLEQILAAAKNVEGIFEEIKRAIIDCSGRH